MSDNQVDEIKQKIDIVSLISERVSLKKSGRNFKGLCPFHGEKSPSFFVTPDMQMFKCFGCGKAGDIFNFLMEFDGLTFVEALENLAARAGVTLVKRELNKSDLERTKVIEILHLAAEYYHFLLTQHPIGQKALAYLKNRGISNQSIEDFKIGYSVDSWDALQQYLVKKKQYTHRELETSGLVIRKSNTDGQLLNHYYDRFRGRLMFPLQTYAGKIVGYSGRTLNPDAKEAKYINSPETDYYHKSEMLFGITQAKRATKEKDRIVIVEGEFDVISLHQIGLKETVAIKGSALTKEHASLIRRLTHNVILSLDADTAGQEAIKRGINVCESEALNLRVVRLIGGKDPDELAKSDPAYLKQSLQQAQSVFAYLIDNACEQFDVNSGEGKKQIVEAVLPQLIKIEHAVEREYYIKKLSTTLKVSESSITEEFSKFKRAHAVGANINPGPIPRWSRSELIERQVIGLALQAIQPNMLLQSIETKWFKEPHLFRLVESIKSKPQTAKNLDIIQSIPVALQPLAQEVYTMQLSWLEESQDNLKQLLSQLSLSLELGWSKRHLVDLTKQMTSGDADETARIGLQSQYRQITSRINQLELAGLREAKESL